MSNCERRGEGGSDWVVEEGAVVVGFRCLIETEEVETEYLGGSFIPKSTMVGFCFLFLLLFFLA